MPPVKKRPAAAVVDEGEGDDAAAEQIKKKPAGQLLPKPAGWNQWAAADDDQDDGHESEGRKT